MDGNSPGSEKVTPDTRSTEGRKVVLRLGVLAILALAVAGAVYLRQETLSQSGVALERLADGPASEVTEPEASLSQPELPTVAEVSVGLGADLETDDPVLEPADALVSAVSEPAAEELPPVFEQPVVASEPPKPLPKLLDLGADKCIPCKKMAPILEELRVQYAGVFDVVFIDVWKNPAEADKYGIRIIPTQIFYDATGKELFRHTGFYSKEQILAKWKQLGLDVGGR